MAAEARPTAHVQHAVRGRIRARVTAADRSPAVMERLRHRLESHPGVEDVQVNARTGSVVVRGEHDQIEKALSAGLNLIRMAASEEPSERGVETLVAMVKVADGQIREASGGRVSLRWLVPAAFVGVGVRKLLADGLTLGTVPWYVLLYYGVDSFLKLYPEHAPRHPAAAAPPPPAG